jgi:hypothetical protein
MFRLVDTGNPILISFAFSVGMFAWAAIYGPLGAFFSELFDTRVRYSGAALSFALAGVLGGAVSPLLSVRLFATTGSITSVSIYLSVMALISFTAFFLLRETYDEDLAETRPVEGALK